MFHARCKIPNIVRKIWFRYNLLLIPITIGKKNFPLIYKPYLTLGVFLSVNFGNHRAAPITWDPIADSPDEMTTIVLSSAERKCHGNMDSTSFLFLFSGVYFEITFRDIL